MKTKSIIIFFVCVLAAAFALGASGVVRLGGNEQPQGQDRLIGMLITTEYLDLFDDEAYFDDNMQQLVSGITPDTSAYEGRLYGQLVDSTDYEDDGTPIYSKEYAFPDSDGIFCYASRIDDGFGEPYITTGGDGVADSHLYINSSDDGEEMKYECVVCVDANTQTDLYFNPVYQTGDGQIYAVSGDSFSYSGGAEGDVYGITLSEDYTVTESGTTTTDCFVISVQTRYVYPAESVSIFRMDKDSGVLSRDDYTLDTLPESIRPSDRAGTEYIIVESGSVDAQGNPVIDRKLYQPSSLCIKVYVPREDGICVPETIQLEW